MTAMNTNLRDRLNPKHPVVGDGYYILPAERMLVSTDEKALIPELLSPEGSSWVAIGDDAPEVGRAAKTEYVNSADLVYRRKVVEKCHQCGWEDRVIHPVFGCLDCLENFERRESLERRRVDERRGRHSMGDDPPSFQKLIEGMMARGARYPNDNFYGLVHETAHGFDLGLPSAEPSAIDSVLTASTQYERLRAEVVAKAVARYVSYYFKFPVFREPTRYASKSVKAFAERRELVVWIPDDFCDETVRMCGGNRILRARDATISCLLGML